VRRDEAWARKIGRIPRRAAQRGARPARRDGRRKGGPRARVSCRCSFHGEASLTDQVTRQSLIQYTCVLYIYIYIYASTFNFITKHIKN